MNGPAPVANGREDVAENLTMVASSQFTLTGYVTRPSKIFHCPKRACCNTVFRNLGRAAFAAKLDFSGSVLFSGY